MMNSQPTVLRRERAVQFWLAVVFSTCAWFGALAIHEAGHVIHALLSGGVIQHVHLPLIGFSHTLAQPNPYPGFVVVGGFIWGVALPWLAWWGVQRLKWSRAYLGQAFASFCFVLNGAYLGLGWIDRVGDVGDLISLGAPIWLLAIVGALMAAYGLWLTHRLGKLSRFGLIHGKADRPAAAVLSAILIGWVAVNLALLS